MSIQYDIENQILTVNDRKFANVPEVEYFILTQCDFAEEYYNNHVLITYSPIE